MAHRKTEPPIILVEDIEQLRRTIEDFVPGADDPTLIRIHSTSGYVDPFTEVITFASADVFIPISGVVGSVTERDELFGINGKIKVGDLKVTYRYDAISGYLNTEIESITLLTAGISGLYIPEGRVFDHVGNTPLFVNYALVPDRND